jgi:hypothetical protein
MIKTEIRKANGIRGYKSFHRFHTAILFFEVKKPTEISKAIGIRGYKPFHRFHTAIRNHQKNDSPEKKSATHVDL